MCQSALCSQKRWSGQKSSSRNGLKSLWRQKCPIGKLVVTIIQQGYLPDGSVLIQELNYTSWQSRPLMIYSACAFFMFFLYRRMCPERCSRCEMPLDQPYQLPCTHYICQCCRTLVGKGSVTQCPAADCGERIEEGRAWAEGAELDISALSNRWVVIKIYSPPCKVNTVGGMVNMPSPCNHHLS